MFCRSCGKELNGEICPGCGVMSPQSNYHAGNFAPAIGKSKVAAGILALLVGWGIYNFYLGYTKKAVIQLMLMIAGLIIVFAGVVITIIGAVGLEAVYLYGGDDSLYIAMLIMGIALIVCAWIALMVVYMWEFVEGIMILCGAIKVDGRGQPLV